MSTKRRTKPAPQTVDPEFTQALRAKFQPAKIPNPDFPRAIWADFKPDSADQLPAEVEAAFQRCLGTVARRHAESLATLRATQPGNQGSQTRQG